MIAAPRTGPIALAYYDALASGDDDAVRRAVSPGYELESSGRIIGLSEYLDRLASYRRAFRDMKRVLRQLTVKGRQAVAVVENSGTHTGTFLSHRPTRRRFQALSIDVLEVERGVVSRATSVFDTLTMLAQLGLYTGAAPLPSRRRR